MSAFQAILVHPVILEWPLLSGCAFLLEFLVTAVRISGRQLQLIRMYKTITGHLRGRSRSSSWVVLAQSRTELSAVLSKTVGSRQRPLTCSATFLYSDAESHYYGRFLDTSQVSRFTIMFSRCSLERRGILCVRVRGIALPSHN
jgi:hypothetical protein